jgi:hypothetical protein
MANEDRVNNDDVIAPDAEGLDSPQAGDAQSGPDMAGPRIEVPPARTGTEAGRTTTAVKLRLRPEDALRLRTAAREYGIDLSEYVARLLDDPQRAEAARVPVSPLPLADVSRLAGALGALPEEVTRAASWAERSVCSSICSRCRRRL